MFDNIILLIFRNSIFFTFYAIHRIFSEQVIAHQNSVWILQRPLNYPNIRTFVPHNYLMEHQLNRGPCVLRMLNCRGPYSEKPSRIFHTIDQWWGKAQMNLSQAVSIFQIKMVVKKRQDHTHPAEYQCVQIHR